MDLTYKQRLFVAFYLGESNGNACDAARRAGYAWPEKQGAQLLGKTRIKAAISSAVASAVISANEVLARLSEFVNADLGDFLDIEDSGEWKVNLWKAKRARKTRLLKKVKSTKDGTEIELYSPLDALDRLARYHGLYKDQPPTPPKPPDPEAGITPDVAAALEAYGYVLASRPAGDGADQPGTLRDPGEQGAMAGEGCPPPPPA